MDRTERFYRIDQLLHDRRIVPRQDLLDELGISLATFKRDLEYLRERLHAPIVWDRDEGGYRFAAPDKNAPHYALPGLWFNASEIYALLTMQHLLSCLQPGILAPHIEPLLARLKALLASTDNPLEEIERRIRIVRIGARRLEVKHFEIIAAAVLKRKRLDVNYYTRSRAEETHRELSPQRLVHYRDNWYLDAWCHLRKGIRSFAVDAIRSAALLDKPAKEVSSRKLDELVGSGYGIFSGKKVSWARLRFTPERARWVASEQWHEKQRARFEEDGSYTLEFPYSDDRELVMDILKFGPDVEVIGPTALRTAVLRKLKLAAARYQG